MNKELKSVTQWACDPRCPVPASSIRSAVRKGVLRAFRVPNGRKYYISLSDITKWLEGASNG